MTLLVEDYTLNKAIELVKNMEEGEEKILIEYYIANLNGRIEANNAIIREYDDWFRKMNQFLPSNNPVFG